MSKVEAKAFVSVHLSGGVNEVTVGDVRAWLDKVQSLGYGDDTVVEECLLSIWAESTNVDGIDCGNHYPVTRRDVLVGTHDCA